MISTRRGFSRYTVDLKNTGTDFCIENRLAGQDNYVVFMRAQYRRMA